MLPITAGFRDTLRAPGGGEATAVAVAPPSVAEGNNAAQFRQVESDMVGTMQELRIDAVERNAAFTAQLEAVRRQRDEAWELITQKVTPARRKADGELRASVEAALASAFAELTARVASVFDRHNASLPPFDERCTSALAVEQQFYTVDIPATNERQSGQAVRTMQYDREEFGLDCTSARGIEAQMHGRVEGHEVGTAGRGDAERADRARQAAFLDTQFTASYEAITDSAHRLQGSVPECTRAVRHGLDAERNARQAGDAGLATSAAEAMAALREAALRYFGSSKQEGEEEGGEEAGEEEDG